MQYWGFTNNAIKFGSESVAVGLRFEIISWIFEMNDWIELGELSSDSLLNNGTDL